MTTDQPLVEALRRGEPQALDRFYRAYAEQVLGWAIRLGGPRLDPEDIAQDVFAIAFRRMSSFRGEARLSTWLFSITRNVIANARRRAAVRKLVGLGTMEDVAVVQPGVDEHLDRVRQRRIVQEALEQLKTNHREVLVLMDLEGRSAPEVSAMLGVPPGTVYSRVHYARKAFARALTSGEIEERITWKAGAAEPSGGG